MKIDLDQIRNLLSVVSQTEITELTIESGDEKITVKKGASVSTAQAPVTFEVPTNGPKPTVPQISPPPAASERAAEPKAEPKQSNHGWLPITSPMVGTFYRSPSPTAPAFVDVGDRVNVGQTVCIIEAMKLMNDMPAEIAGKIVQVCVENGTTVEFGQPLFMVDPAG